jgi:WD40 repeat protein
MISSTNNTITAWKYTRNEIKNVNVTSEYRFSKDELKIAIFITNFPQTSMVWDSQQKCLLTGQRDGKILKWDLTNPNPILEDTLSISSVLEKVGKSHLNRRENQNSGETKRLLQQLREKSIRHKDSLTNPFILEDKNKNIAVSYLLVLKKLQLLAASYYNGYVILWDTILKEYRKCYYDQTTGVYSMAYDSIRNLLFTCGFNHDIYVYDPYIDGSSIYKLTGHSSSINCIDTNEKESELISLDILGNIKIWDTTELINFQTVKINEEVQDTGKKSHQENNTKKKKLSSNLKMVYLRKLKKIFIYGSKVLFFETDRSNFPDLADDQIICSCYYDKTTKNLLSFCLRKINFGIY